MLKTVIYELLLMEHLASKANIIRRQEIQNNTKTPKCENEGPLLLLKSPHWETSSAQKLVKHVLQEIQDSYTKLS